MFRLLIWLGVFFGALTAGTAQAVLVDLTRGDWSGSDKLTFSASGALNYSQGYDGSRHNPVCGSTLACKRDGVGIGDDEIGRGESLKASFGGHAVTLNQVHFLDLFAGEGEHGEYAQMLINFADVGHDSETLVFSATALGDGGYLGSEEFSFSNVLSIEFFTDDKSGKSDFSLAGLEFEWDEDIAADKAKSNGELVQVAAIAGSRQPPTQSVPAPRVLWLMLIGLLLMGLTGARSRRLTGSLPALPIRP